MKLGYCLCGKIEIWWPDVRLRRFYRQSETVDLSNLQKFVLQGGLFCEMILTMMMMMTL